MQTNTTDRAIESRRDQLIRRGQMEDPRLSYVKWAEERLGAGENAIKMGAACERLCYAFEAFENEAIAALGGSSLAVSQAIVQHFGPQFVGDILVRKIAWEARDLGYEGKFSVEEDVAD